MNDPTQFAKEVAELVREQVSRATAPLLERLATLEAVPVAKDGASVTVEDVLPTLLAAIPAPLPGEPGTSVTVEDVLPALLAAIPEPVPGKSVTVEDVLPALLAAIPEPVPGKSVTVEDVLPALLAAIPEPVPGKSVALEDVVAAVLPRVEEAIAALPIPKDGTSVTLAEVKGLLDANVATWALDFERRAQDLLQRAADKMPTPRDGRDATSLEDIDLVLGEDGRTVTIKFTAGEQVREKSIRLATVLDRGVFKDGTEYEQGDAVSWGGSLWIAQAKTAARPEDSRDGTPWRLGVKKGRDGKDLRPDGGKSAEVFRLRGNGA